MYLTPAAERLYSRKSIKASAEEFSDHYLHEYILRTYVLSYSYVPYQNRTTYSYFVIHQITNHFLKLKCLHVVRDNETL